MIEWSSISLRSLKLTVGSDGKIVDIGMKTTHKLSGVRTIFSCARQKLEQTKIHRRTCRVTRSAPTINVEEN